VEDEDKPITCITVDDIDVQLVNGEKLQAKMGTGAAHIAPEPIFKLSWSGFPNSDDPRGGETTLTILGGRSDDVSGVTVLWLPAFNPPEVPPAAGASSGVHATYREAMLKTAVATDSYVYATPTPVQDFLLFPKNTPHFGGTYDPMAILLLTEGQGGTRSLEARAFPPPSFISTPAVSTPETTKPEHLDVEAELAATLESMKVEDDPSDFEVPVSLWSGKNAPVQISLLKVEREAHWKLMGHRQDRMDLPLFGGQAWPQDLDDPRLIKVCSQPGDTPMARAKDSPVPSAPNCDHYTSGSQHQILGL
jgi:syntaxin-binding protein 5